MSVRNDTLDVARKAKPGSVVAARTGALAAGQRRTGISQAIRGDARQNMRLRSTNGQRPGVPLGTRVALGGV
ncbi:MAG: hypothetical protein AB7K71_03890 [Polyangiaceae bacterium]